MEHEVWKAPKEKAMLKAHWRTMGCFRELLVPLPRFEPKVTFTKQVRTAGQNEHICDISYGGVYRKEGNDLIADVTVTWLDGDTELWELRLEQHHDGTSILENRQKKATFTEVVKEVASAGAKVGGKGTEGGLNTAMSASVDSNSAALACMRAALERRI